MTDARTPVSETPVTEEKLAEDAAPAAPAPATAAPAGSGWRPPKLSVRATALIVVLAYDTMSRTVRVPLTPS